MLRRTEHRSKRHGALRLPPPPKAALFLTLCVLALAVSCSGSGPDSPHDVICPVYAPNLLPAPAGPRDIPTESAGTISGTFSVSRTGEAGYNMSLNVPPGRAGVQPSLAIVYNSGQGEGLLGVGFSLAGLSSITRCPQNIAQDGRVRGVRYDEDDKLCLDGLRLVPIGSHEDARRGHVDEYRTFPDTFQRVLAFYPKGWSQAKGPASFEVYTQAGRVLEYGGEQSGRVLGKNGVVRAWWVTREADRRDNAILYKYTNQTDLVDGHTVTHAPLRIDYTDHPSAPASRSIRFRTFAWDAHPYGYTGGMHTGRMMRIDRIEMYGPGNTPVRTYAFGYDASWSTGRARLVSAVECAGDATGACKPPTRFGWLDGMPGFNKITTDIPHPSYDSDLSYFWLATDLDGDGLDDLTITRANPSGSDEEQWLTALSTGQGFGPLQLGATTFRPQKAVNPGETDPGALAHFNIVPHPYDIEGHRGLLFNDPASGSPRWLRRLPNGAMSTTDTGVLLTYRSPEVTSSGVLYADVDGDGVPDLVECEEKDKQTTPDQTKGVWTLRRWRVESNGFTTGFGDPEPIPGMGDRNCLLLHHTRAVDVDGDGKAELLVPPLGYPPNERSLHLCQAPCTYQALAWDKDGWTSTDTQLPPPRIINVLHPTVLYFADVNGDGLPDAFETGFDDFIPRTFLNTGRGFVGPIAAASAADVGIAYFERASTLDYDGDGQTDLLVPMDGHCDGPDQWRPCLVVWRSNPAGDGTFTLIDTKVPVMNPPAATHRTWLSPQVADVNGDGRGDVILPLDGRYTILVSTGPSDLLTWVSDGLNPLEPGDPGHVPNVTITYSHLLDHAKTAGTPDDSPARESETYLPQSDDDNGCWYPRVCVVSPRRVVRTYQTNDGRNHVRTFTVRYRDGREDRRLGFVGFGTRIVTDLDALSGAIERYDNIRYEANTYPYAATPARVWTWSPALPATPGPIELSYKDTTPQLVSTYGGATYFVLTVRAHEMREQGTYPVPGSPSTTLLQYIAATAKSPATILRESTSEVTDHDSFGHVLMRFDHTEGIDETRIVSRDVQNDETDWLIGLVKEERECSLTSTAKACRTTTRTFNNYGELWTEHRGDPNDPETQLTTTLTRDTFGNVTKTSADDALGHHRAACIRYDGEGVFPFATGNPAGHISLYGYDPGLGVKVAEVDPNGLATTWRHDAFGRVALETRPDGTTTHVTLARTKDGGPKANWWRIRTTVAIDGGSETTTEIDALGRTVRAWERGPQVTACSDAQCTPAPTFVRDIEYDSYGRVKRRSLPYLEGDPPSSIHYDEYRYDGINRVVQHTSPWNAVTTVSYDANTVFVDEPGSVHKSTERDPLGRPVVITDAKGGVTTHAYGPFGVLRAVTTPDNLVTSAEYDAYGRVRTQSDPDRGVTETHYDGFGDRTWSKDALGRVVTLTHDALGRLVQRDDTDGTTLWKYDTAPHGIGAIAAVTSPTGEVESYTYDALGRLSTTTLVEDGESFTTGYTYDPKGRLFKLTYPLGPSGAFTVRREYDTFGHLLRVRDSSTVYWRLDAIDGAGRTARETFGNGVSTERGYFADRGTLRDIVTTRPNPAHTKVQDLHYTYDDRNNLYTRSDGLQGLTVERFAHDPLDRLICASLQGGSSCKPGVIACPCNLAVEYEANGNIKRKSDRGDYTYDPAHPHAVATAGADVFKYDAVGNQIARPDATITYTAFDLPKFYALNDGSTIDLAYDGNQHRIRKKTATTDTIYVGGLYERVTHFDKATVEHRHYVSNGERVVAVVTRSDQHPKGEALYLHVDHLGSTDVLTDAAGKEVERRSYDAFGARRNPKWGAAAPKSFSEETTLGFTGQEEDELGLVNLNGRIYDPRLARFLQTDPIVGDPFNGQRWNSYSYVLNSPLRYTDRTGLSPDDNGYGFPESGGGSSGTEPGPSDPQVAFTRAGAAQDWQRWKTAANAVGTATDLVDGNQINLNAAEVTVIGQPADAPQQQAPTWLDRANTFAEGFNHSIQELAWGGMGMVFPVYGLYRTGRGFYEGYKRDGALGVANSVNPLYAFGVAGADVVIGARQGDDRRLGSGIGTFVGMAAMSAAGAWEGSAELPLAEVGEGAAAKGVAAGEAGQFAALDARAVVGDGLTPHHMPQAARGFTSRADGGALVMTAEEHAATRTYGARGRATARAEAGVSFRDTLARDIRDVRGIVGTKYDAGIRALLQYYKQNFPDLMKR